MPKFHLHATAFIRACQDRGIDWQSSLDDLASAIVEIGAAGDVDYGLKSRCRNPDGRDLLFEQLEPCLAIRHRDWAAEDRSIADVTDALRSFAGKRFLRSRGDLDALLERFTNRFPNSCLTDRIRTGRSALREAIADEMVDAEAARTAEVRCGR